MVPDVFTFFTKPGPNGPDRRRDGAPPGVRENPVT